jgi:hypothetical protein
MEFSTYPDLLDCAGFWQCYAGCSEHMQVHKCHQKYTDKKENKIFLISIIRKFRRDRLQSHTYMTNGLLTYG